MHLHFVYDYFSILLGIRKNSHSQQKYVVKHIKKFGQFKKKQYLCNMKDDKYYNILKIISLIGITTCLLLAIYAFVQVIIISQS